MQHPHKITLPIDTPSTQRGHAARNAPALYGVSSCASDGQVAGEIVDRLSTEGAGHWLDHGTEHPHRIALSISADRVASTIAELNSGFKKLNLQARPCLLDCMQAVKSCMLVPTLRSVHDCLA